MPTQTKDQRNSPEEQVSQLIRFKRSESPDEAFWERFDEELRNKQLSALVAQQTWYHKYLVHLEMLGRKAALPSGAVAIIAVAVFGALNSSLLTHSESPEEQLFVTTPPATPPAPLFEVAADQELTSETDMFHGLPATYGVNVLASTAPSEKYILEAAPKTFTSSQSSTTAQPETQLGAKVIRSNHQF